MEKIDKSRLDTRREMALLANFKNAGNPRGIQEVLMRWANMPESDFKTLMAETPFSCFPSS